MEEKKIDELLKNAENGNNDAQYELGKCYYYGIGIEKDIDKAIMLWEQSANQGSNIANNELGSHYYKMGIEKVENREKIIFLEKAINYFLKGNGTSNTYVNTIKKCIIKLNSTYKSESKDSEGLYEKLFDFNNSEILTKLGKDYEFGYNVKQDLKKAFKCYIKAAQIGDSFEEYYRVIYFCVQYEDAIENSLQIAKEYAGKVNDLFKKIETTFDELFS